MFNSPTYHNQHNKYHDDLTIYLLTTPKQLILGTKYFIELASKVYYIWKSLPYLYKLTINCKIAVFLHDNKKLKKFHIFLNLKYWKSKLYIYRKRYYNFVYKLMLISCMFINSHTYYRKYHYYNHCYLTYNKIFSNWLHIYLLWINLSS